MKRIFLTLTLFIFVIPFGISQDLPSYVPKDGLIAYYPFNGNANDESGNGNDGVNTGAVLTIDRHGNSDSSFYFSSDTVDYISADASEFPSGNNPRTISVWYKAQEISSGGISTQLLGYGGGNAFPTNCGESFIMNFENPDIPGGGIGLYEVQGHCQNFRRTSDIPTPLNNTWHHIAVTFDGDVLKFFNNGNLISTYSGVEMSTTVAGKLFCIGRETNETGDAAYTHQDYKGFTGSIDDVVIWNRALTDQEIANFYVSSTSDIILNGIVSAENNQIKNVADPTHGKDAVTKSYTDTKFYTQSEVDALISNLQNQIAILKGDPIDNEGNIYTFKTFGTQTWTTEPAAMETYRDGTVIPQVDSTSDWANLTTGAWCYYENDSSKVKLYNWYAVVGIHDAASLTDVSLRKEFAPEGWHVPSNDELITLIDYFISSGYNYDSTTSFNKIAKAVASKTGWITSTVDGTPGNNSENNNSTGFNLHPHGYRTNTGGFGLSSQAGYFWTVDDAGGGNSVGTLLVYSSVSLGYANSPYAATYSKPFGLSVRLVKD